MTMIPNTDYNTWKQRQKKNVYVDGKRLTTLRMEVERPVKYMKRKKATGDDYILVDLLK